MPGKEIALNFSGGFDSLAAYCLAPDRVKLVSMDFGERFARERHYFERFRPDVVCSTDFREKGFAQHDWRFMAAGSLLFADYLDRGTAAFGSILEESPWNFGTS